MLEYVYELFSDNVILAVLIVALLPTIESKVAIPFALSTQVWGEAVLSPAAALFVALIGTMIPSLFVIWLARKIRSRTSGFIHDKVVIKIQNRYKKNFDKLGKKESTFKKCLLLGTFVAIPLPLTGVYTGSLIAGFTNLKIWQGFLSIFVGELVSCVVVLLLCTMFANSAFYMLIISLILGVVYILISLTIRLISKFKKKGVSGVE